MKLAYASFLDHQEKLVRAMEILPVLLEQGHDLFLIGQGRLCSLLQDAFDLPFFEVRAPFDAEGEDLDELWWSKNGQLGYRLEDFQARAVLLDGENFTPKVADRLRLPTISIDPHHFWERLRLPIHLTPSEIERVVEEKQRIRSRGYRATFYLLPLFFSGQPYHDDTFPCSPLLPKGLTLSPKEGPRFLMRYQRSLDADLRLFFDDFRLPIDIHVPLKKTRPRQEQEKVVVDEAVPGHEGLFRKRRKEAVPAAYEESEIEALLPTSTNAVVYKNAETSDWFADLAACRAVLLDGTLQTIAEALFFQKPILLIPQAGRFDQYIYGKLVESLGVGESHPRLSRAVLEGFLERLPRYQDFAKRPLASQPSFFDELRRILRAIEARRSISSMTKEKSKTKSSHPKGDVESRRAQIEHLLREDDSDDESSIEVVRLPRGSSREDAERSRSKARLPEVADSLESSQATVPPSVETSDGDPSSNLPPVSSTPEDSASPAQAPAKKPYRSRFGLLSRISESKRLSESPDLHVKTSSYEDDQDEDFEGDDLDDDFEGAEIEPPPPRVASAPRKDTKASKEPKRGDDRPRFQSQGPRDSGGDRPRFQGPRDGGSEGGSRPPRFDRRDGGDRPRFQGPRDGGGDERPRFQGPRDDGGEGGSRPPRFDRRDGGDDRPRFQGPRDGGGERPRFQGPRDGGGERPRFQGPRDGGERPRFQGPRDGGGERPPRFDRRDGGGERPRFQGPRDGGGGERPRFQGRRDEGKIERFHPKKREGQGGGEARKDRPFRPSRPGDGGPRRFEGRGGSDRPNRSEGPRRFDKGSRSQKPPSRDKKEAPPRPEKKRSTEDDE